MSLLASGRAPVNPAGAQSPTTPVVQVRGVLDGPTSGTFEVRLEQQAGNVTGDGTLTLNGDPQPVFAAGTLSEGRLFLEMHRDNAAPGSPLFVVAGTPGGTGEWSDEAVNVQGNCSLSLVSAGAGPGLAGKRSLHVRCDVAGSPLDIDLQVTGQGDQGELRAEFRSSRPLGLGQPGITTGQAVLYPFTDGTALCYLDVATSAGRLLFVLPEAGQGQPLDPDSWLYLSDAPTTRQRITGSVTSEATL